MDSANTPPNKVLFDPGWNDPPKLGYNAQPITTNRPRNFLNKRVAFPLSGPPPPSNIPLVPPSGIPPPTGNPQIPLTTPSVITPDVQTPKSLPSDIEIDSENTLKEVSQILLDILESSNELGPKVSSIKKRITMMEEMWQGGKLSQQVQLRMKELAQALKEDNPSKADDIHKALMVENVSAVGTWMPGVKQLIHHSSARAELLAIDKE